MPVVLAFLFSGFLWGMQAQKLFPETISSPFVYIIGAVYIFFFTTLPLIIYYSKKDLSIKEIMKKNQKNIIFSFFFWILSFIFLSAFSYQIFLLGKIILPITRMFSIQDHLLQSLDISYLGIGSFWVGFLILGILASEFFSYIFYKKTNKKFYPLFALIPIISTIISNSNILFCFSLIGIFFAINLLITIKENENTLF